MGLGFIGLTSRRIMALSREVVGGDQWLTSGKSLSQLERAFIFP